MKEKSAAPGLAAGPPCDRRKAREANVKRRSRKSKEEEKKKENAKRKKWSIRKESAAPGLPAWSPTAVLPRLEPA